ncbi:MAG: hypothetical protein AAF270_12985 [Pseudomonadota bacterium]
MGVIVRIASLSVLWILLIDDAVGCRCGKDELTDLHLQAEICRSDSVFVAKAMTSRDEHENGTVHVLGILEALRGASASRIVETAPGFDTACDMQFERSRVYIVFANEAPDVAGLEVSSCGHTRAEPDVEFLDRVRRHISNASTICNQDFAQSYLDLRNDEYRQLVEDTNSILSSESNETK